MFLRIKRLSCQTRASSSIILQNCPTIAKSQPLMGTLAQARLILHEECVMQTSVLSLIQLRPKRWRRFPTSCGSKDDEGWKRICPCAYV